jgi:hypothetical protein
MLFFVGNLLSSTARLGRHLHVAFATPVRCYVILQRGMWLLVYLSLIGVPRGIQYASEMLCFPVTCLSRIMHELCGSALHLTSRRVQGEQREFHRKTSQ